MTDTRGTFRLHTVRQDVLNNEYVPLPNVWLAADGFGYSMWQNRSNLTRTNINTGLAYHNPGLSSPYSTHAKSGFSSPSYGYWSGGGDTNGRSFVNKVTYSTGVHESGLPNMSGPVYESGSISAGEKAYVFAGVWSGSSRSYTQRMTYSNETWAQLPGSNTTHNDWYLSGVNSGSGTGYSVGGYGNTPGTTGKITFSNDSWSALPSGFQRTYYGTGKLRTNTNSWYTGGFINTPSQPFHKVSATHKLTYANDTWARNPTATLPYGINDGASYPYNSSKGALVGGGRQGGDSSMNSSAFTLTFATDTWDATSIAGDSNKYGTESGHNGGCSAAENLASHAGVDGGIRWIDGASPSPNYGYSVSGRNAPSPSYNSTAHKIDFSTDGNSAAPGVNNYGSYQMVFGAGSSTNGYIMGGTDFSPSDGESQVTKVTYSTETRSNLGASHLGARRYSSFAMTHGNTALYVLGGRGPEKSDCRKMTYSNDTFSSVPSNANLSGGRYNGASVATSTAGYTIMGSDGGSGHNGISLVDKITFATETTARIPGADMPTPIARNKGLSESTAGYSVGGRDGPSSTTDSYSFLQKLTFASETGETISPTLTRNTNNMQTLGNDIRGYVVGGNKEPGGTYPTNNYSSAVDKFVYATSTASAVDNLTLGQAVGGGISGGSDNLPFNLPPTATPTASTSPVLNPAVSVSGYWAGGTYDTPGPARARSTTDKVTFATDTTARVPGANTSQSRWAATGSSSLTKGYTSGGVIGYPGSYTNDINALTYSNDTWANLPSRLTYPVRLAYTVNNTTHSYSGGGLDSSPGSSNIRSKIDKLTFSNETASKNIAALTLNRYNGSAVGSATAGYFCGGKSSTSYSDAKLTSVDKLTYSNDNVAQVPSLTVIGENSPIGYGVAETFSFGTNNVGYVCGGQNGNGDFYVTNKNNKITYATDTRTLAPNLWDRRYNNKACSSNLAGYWSGGRSWSNVLLNEGYKMPFSTETWIAGPALPLSTARYFCASFSAAMNGNGLTNTPNRI